MTAAHGSAHHGLVGLAADKELARGASLHALQVLEYALSAPAPRRHRTWVHRVSTALDALKDALDRQMQAETESFGLLSEIALSEPSFAPAIRQLRDDLLEVAVAVASLREKIESYPEFTCDPAEVRDRLAAVTRHFREHLARESDLVYDATGIDLQADGAGRTVSHDD